jgi:quercetin dioxygenase-like cupin family protein
MVNSARAFVVPDGGGTVVTGPAGGPATIKARTETTNGSLALLEVTIGPKEGPPAHTHRREDEAWYLLDGRFRFLADNELFEASPGSFVFVPRGTAHCFQNLEDRPSRLLVLFTPSGMERFFEEHANLPSGPIDAARYEEIAHRSWMEVAGPPLGQSHPL